MVAMGSKGPPNFPELSHSRTVSLTFSESSISTKNDDVEARLLSILNLDDASLSQSPKRRRSSRKGTPIKKGSEKGVRFWMIMIALIISFFLVILDATIISTALPTIASDLHATEFVWVGDAYGITSTALIPLNGKLCEIFGRRPVFLWSLAFFALGSALAGASQTMNWLVIARAIIGIGSGGILALSSIIIADLVPLSERGPYTGLLGLTWAIAGGIGPVVGGSLAQEGKWRWIFYIALPVNGVALVLVFAFLKLPTPPGDMWTKLKRIDWIGNLLIIGSTASIILGLAWGGVQFPWISAQVLPPLLCGGVGLISFIIYEMRWAEYPMVPKQLLSNRTTGSGYLQTAILSTPLLSLWCYLPVYYQACKIATPTASGVDILAISFAVAPFSIISGVSVTILKFYRPQLWTGWAITIIGFGLLTTVESETSRAISIGYQLVVGVGIGCVYSTAYFPVLACLPVEMNAQALSFYVFLRSFSQIWGISIGGAILQNGLLTKLPPSFTSHFPSGIEIAYSTIPEIPHLDPALSLLVQQAFASSLKMIWQVMLGACVLGLICSLPMKHHELTLKLDGKWTGDQGGKNEDFSHYEDDKLLTTPWEPGLEKLDELRFSSEMEYLKAQFGYHALTQVDSV